MKWIFRGVLLIAVLALGFVGVLYGASELGGEVVTLHKSLEDGSVRKTRIWIVENTEGVWIEHGDASSYYMTQLNDDSTLTLERDGAIQKYVAELDPNAHVTYHELRRKKYGWASAIVDAVGGDENTCGGTPVRLSPMT